MITTVIRAAGGAATVLGVVAGEIDPVGHTVDRALHGLICLDSPSRA